ncbi:MULTISPECIES: SixA phosphatase family protein [Sphingomonas]|jgi:phosphohistidine phosphatase|uniref:Histidine phosphatase family protein n=1 Tax=Sphingomonas zeae TaxID=1646122 RepID=A0A7Y6B2Y5_9SPHN|nr:MULTISPECIES: histidine phosphatase family protein [Sphingomonas]MBB4049015.1 phosphohistidine phosphatase [Sphingomonas zeae]MDK8187345.1 histidine phosphatase family protein [Sphingomonas zeae]MDK8217087.1 histidine phosphatase family protein [Sphingomonas sp. UMB7805-LC452B]NUU46482.1 histidine phosphatase family protein [Sphingomonas zeae]
MKTLTLLRHAKSSWDDPISRDFDRPLNAKGRRAAVMIGRQLKSLDLRFDHIVASPAVRVIETLDEVWSGYGRKLEPVWDKAMYLASAASLLDLVHALPEAADHVLMVGHNPGLEDLVLDLTLDGELRERVEDKYPTATVAQMTLPVDRWPDARAHSATLVAFIRPRDLDPTLGPDTP